MFVQDSKQSKMGRRGSQIIPFLTAALASKKYINLKFENIDEFVFSLSLPRKTKKLNSKFEQILKDWRAFKKQPYSYSKAKQAIESALKKSVFVEKIPSHEDTLIYRKLSATEINEKKRVRKALTAVKKEYPDPPSVDSSGYGSGEDSASTSSETTEDLDMKHAVEHDHLLYSLSPIHCPQEYGYTLGFNDEVIPFSQSDVIMHESTFVNPNNILIDDRNTQPPNVYGQTYRNEVMEVDNNEQVLNSNKNENLVTTETQDLAFNALLDYSLGAYDLQDAFGDIPFENSSDSPELDELIKSIGNLIPSSGNKLEIPKKSLKKVYHFKESKSLDDGEIWIFDPEVKELSSFNGNEGDPSSSKMMADHEKPRGMQSCFLEHNLSNGQISVILRRKRLGNL